MRQGLLSKGFMAGLLVTCASNALAAPIAVNGSDVTVSSTPGAPTETIDFSTDNSLIIDGAGTAVTASGPGDITTTANGQGTVSLTNGGDLTVNGNIGASGFAIKSLTTDASGGIVVDKVTGDAYIQKLDINTGATFTSTGGTLDVTGGDGGVADFTASGTINLTDTDVNLEDAISVDGTSAITLAGSTDVDQGINVEAGVAGSTLAISGTADSGAISVGNGSDLSITATATGTTGAISLDAGSTLNIDADNTATLGAIDGVAASNGTVNFHTKSFTLDNAIGATNKVGTVEITGGGINLTAGATIDADTINFAGDSGLIIGNNNVNANLTSNVDGEGNLTFNGTGILTGNIGGVGNVLNTVSYDAVNAYNMATSIHADQVNLVNAADVNLTADTALTSNTAFAVSGASTLNLSSHDLTTAGTANISGASTLNVDVNSASDYGKIVSTGTATVAADTVVNFNMTDKTFLKNGDTYTIVDGGVGGAVGTLGTAATDNSNLFKFVQSANTDDLTFTSQADVAFDTDTQGTAIAGFGAALQSDIEGGNLSSGLFNTMETLAGLSSAQQTMALNNMVPELNGAQVETTFDNQNRIFNTVAKRLNSKEDGLWLDTSYATKEKDTVDSIDGYDADTTSITLGANAKTNATTNLGIAFTYAKTDIEGKDSFAGNKTDVDSYNVTFYGEKDLNSGATVDAQATVGKSQYKSSRDLSAIGAGTAKGDYDALTYGVNANLSKEYNLNGVSVTPVVGLAYNNVSFDDYTETGSSAALNVDKETFESLKTKVGVEVELAKLTLTPSWTAKPAVSGYWNHELMDDSYDYTARLAGANSSFTTKGVDPESDTFTVGTGVSFENNSGWSVGVAYDAELSSDVTTHAAKLAVSKKF